MRRLYEKLVHEHFSKYDQMLFLVGPRQVGKTTVAQHFQQLQQEALYLNWDVTKDRTQILTGQNFIEQHLPIHKLRHQKPLVIFDEIHKFKQWKNYLKGFYDLYKDVFSILVTGSARLDIFQSGGDSLMGRYFEYRIHPFSVRECAQTHSQHIPDHEELFMPCAIPDPIFENLYQFGGFPKPFLEASSRFFQRWQTLRQKQLLTEDIQTLTHIHEVAQLEVLAELLKNQVGQILNRSSLSKKIQVSTQTVARWIETLERFYYCFLITPWSKNITRSLIKEPKLYLWDWSTITNPGMKFENFIASHLLKAVHLWTDMGLGNYSLHYLRDKDQREVDFLITKNQAPWILVEAKSSNDKVSSALKYFQQQTKATFAFQVILEMDYIERSCFEYNIPYIVPAKTFLSQLW